ncbi:hypothetical protein [Halarchaeum nitratireducens]|uniref:Uncharacterized protein n=1 Tax=Halarchaeum nitratireducens TaxID=489913 RepID=A0A830GED4_9EURY|nr:MULTISPECIES: hypothetical protein [Halarchaeum]MBP2252473.1 putative Ca2+/H+ antiporter (TMEM165/GDT1 family) [Halarchaeum solikamskense]GGN20971.1 hypothetical protein GCM10009021_22750 [Halarchaeum nitratireducens]
MTTESARTKPLLAIVGAAVALLALGYAVIMLPVSGMKVVDSTTALAVVGVLFILSGIWVFRNARSTE